MNPAWHRGGAAAALLCLITACSGGGGNASSASSCSTAPSPEAKAALTMFNPETGMSLAGGPAFTYVLDICGHPDLGTVARQRVSTAIDTCLAEDAPRRTAAHVVTADFMRAAQCALTRVKDADPARLDVCRELAPKLESIRARMKGPIDCTKPTFGGDESSFFVDKDPEPSK